MNKLTRAATTKDRKKSVKIGGYQECLTRALMWAFEDVGAELRLIDADHLIAYIHYNAHANISDLIASSVELFFQDGTVTYSNKADMVVSWTSPPRIMLDFEFSNAGVEAKFEMVLASSMTDINLLELKISQPGDSEQSEVDCLVDALKGARLKPCLAEWSPEFVQN